MAKPVAAELNASLLFVPKGTAAPATEQAAEEEVAPPKKTPAPPAPPAAAVEEVRVFLSARMRLSTQERLRKVIFDTRRVKQDLVDEALNFWMDSLGY